MSWNGSGTFNRTYSWVADRIAGLNISSTRMDTDTNDITSNGFGNCLTRDGQGGATANLPMGTFRHTGVGNGVARTDYAALGQVQDGISFAWATASGSADALTATYLPALTALVDGQFCCVRAANANATTTPTFSPNGLTAHTITRVGGVALQVADIPGNLAELFLRYNLANTRWELLNPAQPLINWVVAGGTADALTATYAPAVTTLVDGQLCYVRATAANATTTPTFAPNGLTARTITKLGGSGLVAGDIFGNLAELILRYNLASTRWELLNPANVPVTTEPQGRLTPTTGVPVISADAISATSLFYMPYKGNRCPVWNGTSYQQQSFAQQTLSLVASHLASTLYDVFAFLDGSGNFTIGTGPAWSVSTAGSCARGSGAGTTQLAYQSGLLTNAVQITARNGATTYTVPINQGTYLGSIFIDSAAGQVTCHVGFGQSRKWSVWNAYNRKSVILLAGDATGSWAPAGAVGAVNGNSANVATSFCGLAEEFIVSRYVQRFQVAVNNTTGTSACGIGVNSTSTVSGALAVMAMTTTANTTPSASVTSEATIIPGLGINNIQMLNALAAANATAFGGQSNCQMTSQWLG